MQFRRPSPPEIIRILAFFWISTSSRTAMIYELISGLNQISFMNEGVPFIPNFPLLQFATKRHWRSLFDSAPLSLLSPRLAYQNRVRSLRIIMPSNQSVKQSLVLIDKDPSKVLGLVVGEHKPKPGAFIPRSGKSTAQLSIKRKESTN